MECRVGDATIAYVEHGEGAPVVALHGAGVDHREIEAALEDAVPDGYRRLYPDLPGMGRSSAVGLCSNDDVVTALGDFLDRVIDRPAMVLGHSYGAYLARGLAARRPELVRGLAVVCPVGAAATDLPDHRVVRQDADAHDELDPDLRAGFDEYFVVRTRTTARRYRDHVVPGTELVEEDALGAIFSTWTVDVGSHAFPGPTLIVAGRRDSTAGYADALALSAEYPRATLAVLDDVGHALVHEAPELFAALVRDWLARAA